MLPPVHLALLGGAGFDPAEQTAALSALTPGEQLDCPEECTALLRTVLALGARACSLALQRYRKHSSQRPLTFLSTRRNAVSLGLAQCEDHTTTSKTKRFANG